MRRVYIIKLMNLKDEALVTAFGTPSPTPVFLIFVSVAIDNSYCAHFEFFMTRFDVSRVLSLPCRTRKQCCFQEEGGARYYLNSGVGGIGNSFRYEHRVLDMLGLLLLL